MNHRRAEEIAETARQITESPSREDFIRQACGSDQRLMEQVTAILLFDDDSHQPDAPSTAGVVEKPGDMIGPYKLREQIGSGGFGVVFVADQKRPIRRRVALKMIKPGMDSREVLARFEAERQALAMMDHPNIARVFDAGLAPSGRPFFAMELVRGVPITEYCDANRLSLTERIALFQDVCSAIQHAHQKGIIHRDIKPSNVLVTTIGDRPCLKVIDFGIAKALHEPLGEHTIYTRFSQMIGTPLYMAPEQAQLSGNAVDTRSDIYSLGVLLYVLLTGTTPLDRKRLSTADASEMRRLLVEEEPPAPSLQVSRLSAVLADAATRRGTSPADWKRALRGDLDRIVMKCLEKDPSRRYQTATELAADLDRYLNDEPVLARAPTPAYRFAKFARRHRVGLTVAAGFLLLLVAATAVSTSLAVRAWRAERLAQRAREQEARLRREAEQAAARANLQRRKALEAAERAETVLKFFQDEVLAAARPRQLAGGKGIDVSLREAIDSARNRIGVHFKQQPAVELSIRKVLGMTYWYLGQYASAREELEAAWSLAKQVHGDTDFTTLDIQMKLAMAIGEEGEGTRAVELLSSVIRETDRQLAAARDEAAEDEKGDNIDVTKLVAMRRAAVNDLAAIYAGMRQLEEAARAYQRLWREVRYDSTSPAQAWIRIASNYAVVLEQLDRWNEAETLLDEALEEARRRFGRAHYVTLLLMNNLAPIRHRMGESEEAARMLEVVLKYRRRDLGIDHPDTQTTMMNLALVLAGIGHYPEAEALYREVWSLRTKRWGADDARSLAAQAGIAGALYRQQRMREAADEYDQAYRRAVRAGTVPVADALRWGISGLRTLEKAAQWKLMETRARELLARAAELDAAPTDRAAIQVDLARALLKQAGTDHRSPSTETPPRSAEAKRLLEEAWKELEDHDRVKAQPSGATYEVTRRRVAQTWADWWRLAGDAEQAAMWDRRAANDSE